MRRNIERDQVIGYDDIELPPDRLSDRLRIEQDKLFFGGPASMMDRAAFATAQSLHVPD